MPASRSEEHTSELQSHSEISYAVFCLKKKKTQMGNVNCVTRSLFRKPNVPLAFTPSKYKGILSELLLSTLVFFFFNDTATTEIYTNLNTLSLHDALPI